MNTTNRPEATTRHLSVRLNDSLNRGLNGRSRIKSKRSAGLFVLATLIGVLLVIIPATLVAQGRPGGGGGGGSSSSGGPPIVEATVSRRSHAITVTGRLEPRDRIVHRIPSSGFVDSISVRQGDLVRPGQEMLRVRRRDDVLGQYRPVLLEARISGLVSVVHVRPEADVSTADPAVTVLDTNGYKLYANVSDKDAFRIGVGGTVTGQTSEGHRISGSLVSRSQEPDYSTGLFELTFQFGADRDVQIGEFVMIDLPVDRVEGVFVHRDAVIRRYGSYFIWLVTPDGTLTAGEVELGDPFDDEILVLSGLKPGDRYLSRPTGRERDGMAL